MNTVEKKLIVLTPVKNEAWILHRFLQVCSSFADHIIIADQQSTDGSLDIYSQYPKVIVIKNEKNVYNEDERQLLLINAARNLFGLGNTLLAIDADEILAANAVETAEWQKMLQAPLGTILYFEKPTFYKSTQTAIRYDGNGWPLGYVDDGAPHNPSPIHSTRIPTPDYAKKLYLKEIKLLHYALVRLDAQSSKMRMYSMVENINKTIPPRLRRKLYNSENDFKMEGNSHEVPDKNWFTHWEKKGIDMHSIIKSDYYWYDIESLEMFKTYGLKRFIKDDVWNYDWENIRNKLINQGYQNLPKFPIIPPNRYYLSILRIYYNSLNFVLMKIKKLIYKI